MVANRKPTGRAVSIPAGLTLGCISALLWTMAGVMLIAKLIDSEVIQETAIGYGASAILITASLLSSVLAFHKIKRQRVLICMAAGGTYFLSLLGITALFFGGQYQAVGVTAALVLAGSGTAVLLGVAPRGGKGHRRYKKSGM